MSALHGFWALILTTSETLLLLVPDVAAVPFSAFDVQLDEVAVTRDPYHLLEEVHVIHVLGQNRKMTLRYFPVRRVRSRRSDRASCTRARTLPAAAGGSPTRTSCSCSRRRGRWARS